MHIRGTWVRGGTSKCWVFETQALEQAGVTADDLLPRIYGSPDHRQLDGVGGGTSTTSKAMLLTPAEEEGVDVVFTFAQVGIDEAKVDWGSNCGNCSTTAGLYAVENGWVGLGEEFTYVRTYNTNSNQLIVQRIATPGGQLPDEPKAMMPGTVYPGHEVGLGFLDPMGKTTGTLLPAGESSELTVGTRSYSVTMVDAGAPAVLLSSETLGLDQVPHAKWAEEVLPMLPELDEVRRRAALVMGMVETTQEAERAVPKLGIVGPSSAEDADLEILMLSMGKPHPAMPITGSVALTMAAFTPGTHPFEYAGLGATSGNFRLRTPAGVIDTFLERSDKGEVIVGVDRTARTLATATLYLPDAALAS